MEKAGIKQREFAFNICNLNNQELLFFQFQLCNMREGKSNNIRILSRCGTRGHYVKTMKYSINYNIVEKDRCNVRIGKNNLTVI